MSGKSSPSKCKSVLGELDTWDISDTKKDCIRALCEKQIPKEPENGTVGGQDYYCPSCNKYIYSLHRSYCSNCGQALKWE